MKRPSTQWLAGLICVCAAGIALYWGWARELIAIDPYAEAHQQIRLLVSKNAEVDELVRVGNDDPDTANAILRAR